MSNKMLIDAAHPEETRVVVVRGRRVEDFDFEAASRKPLRGNIYLAKVTRVEPSLQAAFVDYGGNRHGFLAFSEIHPDYYQIPYADRQALIADEEAEADEAERASGNGNGKGSGKAGADGEDGEDSEDREADEVVEQAGADDALEEVRARRSKRSQRRTYKIQEVIKRRQILLVQVVKEERGTKGAALTTYLSLAGRYCVLMPNTSRGGGISRKITDGPDRKRLKEIVGDLQVPEGMGVILRTAGASRTRVEIRRDFEYLLRMWESVRELTLKSVAPKLVYEEGSLTKRAIRDLYNRDISEVLVAGEHGYREAKDFMRMLMPSHAKNIKQYKDVTPIFTNFGVERQLDAMFSPQVTLPSGGYIVINPTEALVSIDVNSGRATKEHSIEDTALQTNLEAAEEVARQLRLRDLAGLIVVDFIDMDEKRNNRSVEKKLKDCLKFDRARIQVGRISPFGLLEMSRQRIRTGVVESSTVPCVHCQGIGYVRSVPSVALHALRALEDHLLADHDHHCTLKTATDVALYILNQKRGHLNDLEARFRLSITVEADETLGVQHLSIARGEPVEREEGEAPAITMQPPAADEEAEAAADAAAEAAATAAEEDEERQAAGENGGSSRRRRRRRRRKGGDGAGEEAETAAAAGAPADVPDQETAETAPASETEGVAEPAEAASDSDGDGDGDGETDDGGSRSRRRRGRRGGRRHKREREGEAEAGAEAAEGEGAAAETGVREDTAVEAEGEETRPVGDEAPEEGGHVAVIPIREPGEPAEAADAGVPARTTAPETPLEDLPPWEEAPSPAGPESFAGEEPPAPAAPVGWAIEPAPWQEVPPPAAGGEAAPDATAAERPADTLPTPDQAEAGVAETEPASEADTAEPEEAPAQSEAAANDRAAAEAGPAHEAADQATEEGAAADEAATAHASGNGHGGPAEGDGGETAGADEADRAPTTDKAAERPRERPRRVGWWQRRSFF